MQRTLLLVLPFVSTVLFVSRPAEADIGHDKVVTTNPVRDGFTMGATFGRGSIDVRCATCRDAKLTEALSVSAHVGYMVTPRLALLGEQWSVRYNARGGALFDDSARHLVAQHMSTIAGQLFVTNRLWVKAGLGVGWHITDGDYDNAPRSASPMPTSPMPIASRSPSIPEERPEGRVTGTATFAAIGLELAHNSVLAVDLQFRVGTTRRPDDRYQVYNTGLNVGFNWY